MAVERVKVKGDSELHSWSLVGETSHSGVLEISHGPPCGEREASLPEGARRTKSFNSSGASLYGSVKKHNSNVWFNVSLNV